MKVLATKQEKKPGMANGTATVRMKFAKARKFINPVNYIIQMGYVPRKRGHKLKTPIGRAMTTLLTEAMVGTYPEIEVDPAKAKLSVGIRHRPRIISLVRESARITMTWDTYVSRPHEGEYDDRILLCAYAVAQELAAVNEEEVLRETGVLSMTLPEGMEQLPVHLYMIVYDRDRKNFSNSMYLGLFNG